MAITSIRLRNFRGFRDAKIELKPLTVLLGPNSAGKSAFGHALAAMAHAHKFYSTGPQVSLTPPVRDVERWPVDLGKTDDLRTLGTEGPIRIELETSAGLIELGFGGLSDTNELLLSHIVHPSGEESIATKQTIQSPESAINPSVSASIDLGYEVQSPDTYIRLTRINRQQWREGDTEVSVIINGLILKAAQHMTGTNRLLSRAASNELLSLLENLVYLRATRKRPSRGYQNDFGEQQPIGYSGEWAPSVLHKHGHDPLQYLMLDDAKSHTSKWSAHNESLANAVATWLSSTRLAQRIKTIPPNAPDTSIKLRIALDEVAFHDVTEVGFGLSQIIPVFTAGLLQPKESLLIVDLPEAHLHPRPQGLVADFFCSLAKSERNTLVETHSEMFFHRLRLRAAMDPELMQNIAVYFIDPPKDGACCVPRRIGLRYEEELSWPKDFLDEAYENEIQINAVRQERERQS